MPRAQLATPRVVHQGMLAIVTERLDARAETIVEHVCAQPEMIDAANLPGRN